MIQPPPEQSPIANMIAMMELMVKNRRMIPEVFEWAHIIDDCSILMHGPTLSCKTPWGRNTAAALFAAHRIMKSSNGSEQDRAERALRVLESCEDSNIRITCSDWLRRKYNLVKLNVA